MLGVRQHRSIVDRTISSRITPFVKFILPVVWGAGWGLFTILEFRRSQPTVVKWISLVVWVPATLLLARLVVRLRRVRIDDHGLLISNYRREIHVPFAAIANVTYLRTAVGGSQYVTVTFRHMTPLGRRAVFLPVGRRDRELAEELRKRAGLTGTSGRAPAV